MSALAIIAISAGVIAWVHMMRQEIAEAGRLLDPDLPADMAERREAAKALGLSQRETERRLRQYFGAEAVRRCRALEQARAQPASQDGAAAPRSRRGRRHD